jgi:aspartate/methionine/tyrosine aminotransferase
VQLEDFALERYFAQWEFTAKYLLCSSDVEGYPMAELLALADDESRGLWSGLRLGYTESRGLPLLRAEIASLYEGIDADEVLTFAGAEEGIFVALNCLLGAGDHAIVTWPAYQSLHEVARATGAEVSLVRLQASEGWAIDVEAVRRLLRPTTRVIVVNVPHNPTGMLPDAATWRALIGLAEEAGVWLLSDEVYRYLEFDEGGRIPAAAERLERGISLGVMSKSFALAGLRIGWIATRDREVLDRAARFKDYTTICNSAPSEILALIALRARERVLARSRAILRPNLERLDGFFADWAGVFEWVRPRGGSIGFPRLLAAGVGIDQVAADLVEQEGVLILPGSKLGHDGNHFRIGFGRRDFAEGLERFERFARRVIRED